MIIHVWEKATQDGDGSSERPFRSITEAARVAEPGDEVIVAPGIYREYVDPQHAGLPDHRIIYRSEKVNGAVITGAERVTCWEKSGSIYRAEIPNSLFGSYNPYTTTVHGDWYWATVPAHTGEVYLNGNSLYEVESLDQVQNPVPNRSSWKPEDTVYTWYTQQSTDGSKTILWANFQELDPNRENVEINVRRNCFYPSGEGIGYITLSGFTIRQAATQWAPPTAYQDGMVGPHWSKGWIIENCNISHSKCSGISLGKYLQPGNDNKWTTRFVKDGAQTEREAICQAQREGWSKENIGSHIIRCCDIHDCGQTGIVGHLGGVFSLIEDNHIHHINNKQNLAGAEIGGIKMHAAIDVMIRRNHIDHCTRGLWLDWQAQGTRVSQNLFHDNVPPQGTIINTGLALGEDIFVEVSHGPTLIDHNILLSDISCRLSTQGFALVHNLIAGSFSYVGNGTDNGGKKFPTPRYTPYHVPHQTEIAGFMTILHGDARFYNNIFVQKEIRPDLQTYIKSVGQDHINSYQFGCGTFPYDGYPTAAEYFGRFDAHSYERYDSTDRYYDHLPVYTGGNIFFNGARPCDTEKDAVVEEHAVTLILDQEKGETVLRTDLYDYLRKQQESKMVSTEMLGEAFEPEQRFENPDGTDILFDRDFFGTHREVFPLAGPFELPQQIYRLPERPVCMEKDNSRRISEDRDNGAEQNITHKQIQADIALTGCEQLCMIEADKEHFVQEIFIQDNMAWIHFVGEKGLFELDCEYGISHYINEWEVEAADSADVRQTAGGYAIAGSVTGLLEILRKKSARNPEEISSVMAGKAAPILEKNGIVMRFTPQHIKFIRDRKFITLSQAAEAECSVLSEVVAEVLE